MTEQNSTDLKPALSAETVDPVPDPVVPRTNAAQRFFRGRTWKRLRRNRGAMLSLAYLIVLTLAAVFAPIISPHDPRDQDLKNRLQSPNGEYWLGTDSLGRDVFSRLLDASGVALLAVVQALLVAIVLGAFLGMVAGYAGKFIDGALSRVVDALMSMPPLILAVAIVGILGPGLTNAMLAIGVVMTPSFYRVVRSATMVVREATFVESARASGCSTSRILFRHVLPTISSPLLVQVSFAAGVAIVSEASLSFLGLGVQPPQASWGSMLTVAFDELNDAKFLVFPPAIAIALTILAFSTLGDGLRDALGRQNEGAR